MVKNWLKKYFRAPKFLSRFTPDLKTRRQKRPFIIPSRFGFYFGSGILVLIALAYTYANQLIYLVAFFYSSILFISMHLTNNNIKSLEISEFFIRNFFQDETGSVKITLHNNHSKYFARFIQLEVVDTGIKTLIDEIPPNTFKTVEISFNQKNRGRYSYPKVVVSTKFPFNFFYSWKRLSWNEQFFVYPAREGTAEPPYTSEDDLAKKVDLTTSLNASNSDNFLGHREYNSYDNYKRIDWKVFARKNKLFVKTYEDEASRICFVDFSEYFKGFGDFEKQVKQLTKWIFDSQKWNTIFVVRVSESDVTFLDDRKKFEIIFEKLSLFSPQDIS